MPQYALASHVHACKVRDQIILLDLKANRYLGVQCSESETGFRVLEGWLTDDAAGRIAAVSDDTARQLADRHLLVADAAHASQRRLVNIASPIQPLIDGYAVERPAARLMDILRFVRACAVTAARMRVMRLDSLVARIHRRNLRRRKWPASSDREKAKRAVAVFLRLRPILFTANDACLFEGFALSEFLASYGIYPRVVIGVTTKPFSAHCWVQEESVTYNDTPDHARKFLPILVA